MKLKLYLYSQLSQTFFPIFFGLFFITSIIFLVKIASLTSAIAIDLIELLKLYSYVMPSIIFYTLPISFFISLVAMLSKLSSEYELIVVTSFGLNPVNIIKQLLPITAILSFALIVISLGLMPKSKHLNKIFIEQKKKEANFNIKASEFGQKFGDWLIYIDGKDDKTYKNVKLLKIEEKKDHFVLAKNAELKNENGNLSFNIENGKSFVIEGEQFNQIDFENMILNDSLSNDYLKEFTNSYEFWQKNLKNNRDLDDFSLYILVSIFPLISLFLVVYSSYFNPRYEKNKSIMKAIAFVTIYYVFIQLAISSTLLHSIYIVPIIWLLFTYFIYQRSVKQQY